MQIIKRVEIGCFHSQPARDRMIATPMRIKDLPGVGLTISNKPGYNHYFLPLSHANVFRADVVDMLSGLSVSAKTECLWFTTYHLRIDKVDSFKYEVHIVPIQDDAPPSAWSAKMTEPGVHMLKWMLHLCAAAFIGPDPVPAVQIGAALPREVENLF